MLRLEELLFRPDEREGGTVIEFSVDGRRKTQIVPRMVGEILEAEVRDILWLKATLGEIVAKEKERERSTVIDRGDGIPVIARASPGTARRGRPAKTKAKANT
jgi:hypothetical protein